MQRRDEHGPLDGKLEAAVSQQISQNRVDPEPLRDPPNSRGPPMRLAVSDIPLSLASASNAWISRT